jgi:hypothetical protein
MHDAQLQALTDFLWPDGDTLKGQQVYWVLDGARDPDIVGLLQSGGLEYTCLFSGELHPRLQAAAPYLVHLAAGSATTNRLLRRGWGNAWGILTITDAELTLDQLRLHLKKFLRVQTEAGQQLAFRYYDPRVLNIYLPTCTDEEFRIMLGPITRMVAESDGGASAHVFDCDRNRMRRQEYPVVADIQA